MSRSRTLEDRGRYMQPRVFGKRMQMERFITDKVYCLVMRWPLLIRRTLRRRSKTSTHSDGDTSTQSCHRRLIDPTYVLHIQRKMVTYKKFSVVKSMNIFAKCAILWPSPHAIMSLLTSPVFLSWAEARPWARSHCRTTSFLPSQTRSSHNKAVQSHHALVITKKRN